MSKEVATRAPTGWRAFFEVASTIVMIALAATLVRQGRGQFLNGPTPASRTAPLPKAPIGIDGNAKLGVPTARVALLAYSDFECPFCGVVARETMPALFGEYVDTGRVVFVFKNLPLPFHALAQGAAIAALCAAKQGRFRPMHDQLFRQPMRLAQQDLSAAATRAGLDLPAFESCQSDAEMRRLLEAEKAEADMLQITGTPTFVFGRVTATGQVQATDVLTGAKPTERFTAILNRLLD